MAAEQKRYVVRLEDPDSEHFRETTLLADSKDAAAWWCEGRERKMVDWRLPDDEVAKLRKNRDKLTGEDKARLQTHEQTKPYEVVSVTEAAKK